MRIFNVKIKDAHINCMQMEHPDQFKKTDFIVEIPQKLHTKLDKLD